MNRVFDMVDIMDGTAVDKVDSLQNTIDRLGAALELVYNSVPEAADFMELHDIVPKEESYDY